MRVFISWSGDHSRQVAEALRDWLPMVIQAVKPWVSAADIEKGETWFSSIQDSLAEAKGMGIFCLTPDNVAAPWLAFEAGALSAHDRGRVATFLHVVEASAVKPPLSLFQATKAAEKSDVLSLLKSINGRLDDPLDTALLQRTFDANWESLFHVLEEITVKPIESKSGVDSSEDVLKEILNTVRRLERDVDDTTESRIRYNPRLLAAAELLYPAAALDRWKNMSPADKEDAKNQYFALKALEKLASPNPNDWREPPDMGEEVVARSRGFVRRKE